MKFTPETDEQIELSKLIKEGRYRAKIFEARDKDSDGNPLKTKKGAEKFDITLKLFIEDENIKFFDTNITPAYKKLLKHFCDASGLEEKYNQGNLTCQDCNDSNIEFIVEIVQKQLKNYEGKIIYVNNVSDYFKIEDEKFITDDLPF